VSAGSGERTSNSVTDTEGRETVAVTSDPLDAGPHGDPVYAKTPRSSVISARTNQLMLTWPAGAIASANSRVGGTGSPGASGPLSALATNSGTYRPIGNTIRIGSF